MNTFIVFFMFAVSLVVIIKGGDWFVESAVWVAKATGIPNVLIGATIVSVATTLPELLVSSIATYNEYYDIAIGNVVGSTICNIGFILGLVAVLAPIKIERKGFFIKGSFMLFSAIVLLFLLKDTIITRKEGSILLILFAIYVIFNIIELKIESKNQSITNEATITKKDEAFKIIIKFIGGAILIVIGAKILVESGSEIARFLKIPEQVISLTLIAIGTSLPELITAISSMLKGEQGISIGNILGANILNMLMVLGVSSKIGSKGIVTSYQNIMLGTKIYNIPQTLYLDMPMSLLVMLILIVGGLFSKKIGRVLGVSLVASYIMYLTVLAKLFM